MFDSKLLRDEKCQEEGVRFASHNVDVGAWLEGCRFLVGQYLLGGTVCCDTDVVKEPVRAKVAFKLTCQIRDASKYGARAFFDPVSSNAECERFVDEFERQVVTVLANLPEGAPIVTQWKQRSG